MKSITYTLAILLLFISNLNYAQDYHVTKNGDDDNSGNQSSPWRSIQHAMDYATPGSTVHIHEGIYKEALYVNVSGSDNNYITFIAFENDEVIIDAEGQTSTAVIEVYNVHHIAIENLIIRNHQRNDAVGILVEGACDHIRIDDCEIYDIHFSTNPNDEISSQTNAHGIAVYGDNSNHSITDLEILDNEIHDCRLGYSEALVVNGNIDGFIINDNEVYDVTNIGIDVIGHEGTCDDPSKDQARNGIISQNTTYNCQSPYATSAGIYVDGGKNLVIEQNRVYNNQWGIEIGCENVGKSTDNIIVRNNLVYGNTTAGLALGGYDYPSGSGKVTNVVVTNNTFYDNDKEEDYTGELFMSYCENVTIDNNIFYGTASTGYVFSTEDQSTSQNVKFRNNNWLSTEGAGKEEYYYNGEDYQGIEEFESAVSEVTGSLSQDPQFSLLGSDPKFGLKPTSGMIDKGFAGSEIGSEDFSENERVVGNGVDIGAYEYNPTVYTSSIEQSLIEVYPNPTRSFINTKGGYISKIFNSRGNHMYTNPNEQISIIDISDWASGIYFLQLSDGTNKKIFIE